MSVNVASFWDEAIDEPKASGTSVIEVVWKRHRAVWTFGGILKEAGIFSSVKHELNTEFMLVTESGIRSEKSSGMFFKAESS